MTKRGEHTSVFHHFYMTHMHILRGRNSTSCTFVGGENHRGDAYTKGEKTSFYEKTLFCCVLLYVLYHFFFFFFYVFVFGLSFIFSFILHPSCIIFYPCSYLIFFPFFLLTHLSIRDKKGESILKSIPKCIIISI